MKLIVNLSAVIFTSCVISAVSASPSQARDTVLKDSGSFPISSHHAFPGDNSDGSGGGFKAYQPTSSAGAFKNYFAESGRQYASADAKRAGVASPRNTSRRIRGTGFYVASGTILTNAHVVKSCSKIMIDDKIAGAGASVIAIDKDRDLAAIRTSQTSGAWGNVASRNARQSDDLLVAGYPTEGRANAVYEEFRATVANAGENGKAKRVHFSGNVKKGNSGGPALNASGDVAGVVVGRVKLMFASADSGAFSSMKSSGVAISADVVKSFMRENGVSNPTCRGQNCKKAKEIVAKITCIK